MMYKTKRVVSLLLIATLAVAMGLQSFAAQTFSDVRPGDWYAAAVDHMTEAGLMNGTGNGQFSPAGTLTRAMLATVFYRMAGSPAVTGTDAFTDTAAGLWYSDAVLWASRQKLAEGYGNGLFGTNDPVTQEQLVTILWRYAGQPAASGSASDASGWAANAVSWARGSGVVDETVGYVFAPRQNASRAQIAAILSGYLKAQTAATGPRVLIAYFAVAENSDVDAVSSASVVSGTDKGMSRYLAEMIAERTGGELFAIRTETKYPGSYNKLLDVARDERNDDALPALTSHIGNLDDYDVIFVGYPIWWYTMPQAMYSFFEEYDFSGKTIIPFNTHAGSGNGGTYRTIAELEPKADVKDGLAVSQTSITSSRQSVSGWLDKLGY